MSSLPKLHDALIIGGGPAGLSVALGLARQHKSCVVFSDSKFRNEGAEDMYSVASQDGERPAEFRRITREQIVKYGNTTFVDMTVMSACKEAINGYDGFKATDKDGHKWLGKKLAFASGSKDIRPEIEGYEENWPRNIYQCLFCDGHERSHLPKGILGFPSPMHLMLAQMALSISSEDSSVTIFTNGLTDESADIQRAWTTATALGIKIENREIRRLNFLAECLNVVLDDGEEVYMGFLGHSPGSVPAAPNLMASLALKMVDTPTGVFVCGDVGSAMKHVTHQGALAAAGIVHELHNEEAKAALARYQDSCEISKASSVDGIYHETSIAETVV